jgi:hypothetical protein
LASDPDFGGRTRDLGMLPADFKGFPATKTTPPDERKMNRFFGRRSAGAC